MKEINKSELMRIQNEGGNASRVISFPSSSAAATFSSSSSSTAVKASEDSPATYATEADEVGGGGSSTNRSITVKEMRAPTRIELSLIHNKDVQANLAESLYSETLSSYAEATKLLVKREVALNNMPRVRKYRVFKSLGGGTSSSQPSSGGAEEGATTTTKKGGGEEEKKVRFLQHEVFSSVSGAKEYPVYLYAYQQNHWKPDIRESQTLVLENKKAFLFGGVGKQLYNQLTELDLGKKGENEPCAR